MEKRVWPVRMTLVVEKPITGLCMSEAMRMRIRGTEAVKRQWRNALYEEYECVIDCPAELKHAMSIVRRPVEGYGLQ